MQATEASATGKADLIVITNRHRPRAERCLIHELQLLLPVYSLLTIVLRPKYVDVL